MMLLEQLGIYGWSEWDENLLLVIYVMRHLRGDTILDPSHDNNSTTSKQLALALVAKKVQLEGALIQVI